MSRPVCYDVTHLVSRLGVRAPTGIDKVDQAYGRHFAARGLGPGVHYGLIRPHVLAPHRISTIVDLSVLASWEQGEENQPGHIDPPFETLYRWLLNRDGEGVGSSVTSNDRTSVTSNDRRPRRSPSRHLAKLRYRITHDRLPIPEGAVYLNAAQHVFEVPHFFKWLEQRKDVRAVLLIHDLLPLDVPEYFPSGYRTRFDKRVSTALRYATAFITTTHAVRQRLSDELRLRGLTQVPICVAPLPSSLKWSEAAGASDAHLSQVPYFVVIGTIEPRKNHLLLLNIWRQLAERGAPVPKLVVVGGRGWENEQVLDVLDRGLLTRPHVREVSGLRTASLVRLIKNARAVLMPSYAEGYGLPIVEALTLGTPVIASDIAVFHEVAQECALFKHPLDGVGWREAIVSLMDDQAPALRKLQALAAQFNPPTWSDYFRGVEGFLEDC